MSELRLILRSTITCPACGGAKTETMPTDACIFFYDCGSCGTRLKPKPGDCCVFCSYGTVPCPPVQSAGRAGACCPDEEAATAAAAARSGASLALRPGVAWPLWPPVTDPAARQALETSLAATRWLEKWVGLERDEDRVWQQILRGFARTGTAQDAASLARMAHLEAPVVAEILRGLRGRDMVVLADEGATVTAAYPFCAWSTGHEVSHGGARPVPALCAIDALGAGAMLGQEALVESACRSCGAPVRIATRERGQALGTVTPSTAVVWYGVRYADNCSATSSCTLKAFFCSQAHLVAWRDSGDRDGLGFALSLPAALQIALAVFMPLLMPEAPGLP